MTSNIMVQVAMFLSLQQLEKMYKPINTATAVVRYYYYYMYVCMILIVAILVVDLI